MFNTTTKSNSEWTLTRTARGRVVHLISDCDSVFAGAEENVGDQLREASEAHQECAESHPPRLVTLAPDVGHGDGRHDSAHIPPALDDAWNVRGRFNVCDK